MSEKLLKKVTLLSEQSVPEARGLRLKRVRNLTNLSRKDFCELSGLNINTLKGWEIGRYGGLPRDGALRIIDAAKQKQVNCSLLWLLHGEGNGPRLESDQDQRLIFSEIELFEKLINHPILSCKITDDAVSPYYNINAWVAGLCLDLVHQEQFIGKICIIKFSDQILVRKVQLGKKDGYYNLFCTNPRSQSDPVIVDVKIDAIALINRVYCA